MSTTEAFFRSADMLLVQFYIASEVSRDCVSVLGEMGNVQFRDMNKSVNSFQRSFVKEIRKFDTSERHLRYLYLTLAKQEVTIPTTSFDHLITPPSANISLVNRSNYQLTTSQMDDLIKVIETYESNIRHMSETYDDLLGRQMDLLQHRMVLQGTRKFFDARLSMELNDDNSTFNQVRLSNDSDNFLISDDENDDILLESGLGHHGNTTNTNNNITSTGRNEMNILGSTMNFISGTIETSKLLILERILWRSLRGNLYINHIPVEEPVVDPKTGEKSYKCIFLLFTHGDTLIKRCKKIVESLDGELYNVDSDYDVYQSELRTVNNKLKDLNEVLEHTHDRLILELKEIALEIEKWNIDILKEKSIYEILNFFNYDEARRCLIGEGWIPKDDLPYIKSALKEVTDSVDTDLNSVVNVINTNMTPPTYHKTNKFTSSFQSIIDAYGIATYQEVNPGLATIVTFPFMFAIMFGDVGHGFILFLAALTLVLNEKKIGLMKNRDEIFDMAYTGRYILLLMGIFSMYTGFLYNDLFSKSMDFFKSGWSWPKGFNEGESIVATSTGGVYAIGIDPAWHGTDNNLLFTNSYKMKLSILMGFVHMSYSFYFSLVNFRFFKSRVDIIGNFIPGLLFMQSIFGYLTITIVYKWCIDWVKIGKPAPGLLNMLINMFLAPGTIDEQLYPGQAVIQIILVLIALVCIPWLLLYKPLTLKKMNSQKVQLGYADLEDRSHSNITDDGIFRTTTTTSSTDVDDFLVEDVFIDNHEEQEPEAFNFGDIMVNQVIHTIEFCLNCVSHTASYLRLWALSLAHNQLSAVLWEMTIQNSFVPYEEIGFLGSIIVVFLFGMWFVLTVCILVVMEGTSAMLHSLRLHWVEAMSKFFEGEGYPYEPFSFYQILVSSQDNEA